MWVRAIALMLVFLLAGCLKPVLPTGSSSLSSGMIGAGLQLYRVPLRVSLAGRQTQMLPVSWSKVLLSVSSGSLKVPQTYLYDPGTPNPTTINPPSDTFRLPLNTTVQLRAELQSATGAPVAYGETSVNVPNTPGLVTANVTVHPLRAVLTDVHPRIARPGDLVTLEGFFPGSNAANYAVSFPGGPATVTTVSSSSLTVSPPAGGAGPVSVSYLGDTSGNARFRSASFPLGLKPFQIHADLTAPMRPFVELSTPRSAYTLTTVGRYVYAIGGSDHTNTVLSSIERAPIHADGTLGRFEPVAGSLSGPRREHTAHVIGNRLYVIGGTDGTTNLGTVESAPLDANGNLTGGFTVAPCALTTPRFGHASAVAGSYLYVLGGNVGGSALDTVERATIHGNGDLGPFINLSPAIHLDSPRYAPTCVVSGRNLYLLGGWNPTLLNTVEKAHLTPDGTLDIGAAANGFSATALTLATARYAATSVVLGNRLFVVGGQTSTGYTTSIETTPLLTDGTLSGSLTAASVSLANPRRAPCSVVAGNHLYVVGGLDSTGYASRTAEAAEINSSGALGSFGNAGQPTLVTARSGHSLALVKEHLYVVGGTGASPLASIEAALVSEDGSLGAFSTAGIPPLQTPRSYHTSVVIKDKLYVIGGMVGGAATNSLEVAPLNPDGTFAGPFTSAGVPALLAARYGHASFVLGNYLYVLSGYGASFRYDMERAPINPDGTLGAFQNTGSGLYNLNTARMHFACVVLHDKLYAIGGAGGPVDIEYATLNPDGTLAGGFSYATGFNTNRDGLTAAIVGGTLQLFGGFESTTYGDVLQAGINPDGTLAANFAPLGVSCTPRSQHASLVIGNFLYVIGGQDGGGAMLNSVERAPLQ